MRGYAFYSPANPYLGGLTSPDPEVQELVRLFTGPDGELDFAVRRPVPIESHGRKTIQSLTLRAARQARTNAWEWRHRRAARLDELRSRPATKVAPCALCHRMLARLRVDRHPVTFRPIYSVKAAEQLDLDRRVPATRICAQCGHLLEWINSRRGGVSSSRSTLEILAEIITDHESPVERVALLSRYQADLRALGAYLRDHGGYAGGYRPRGKRARSLMMDVVDAADAAVTASRIPNT